VFLKRSKSSDEWENPIYEELATTVEVACDANDNHNECDVEMSEENFADPLDLTNHENISHELAAMYEMKTNTTRTAEVLLLATIRLTIQVPHSVLLGKFNQKKVFVLGPWLALDTCSRQATVLIMSMMVLIE
jgi:hypothetical protein